MSRFHRTLPLVLALALAACEIPPELLGAPAPAPAPAPSPAPQEPQRPPTIAELGPADAGVLPIEEEPGPLETLGSPEVPLGTGYRDPNDPCRFVGESSYTRRFFDASADLVACLRGGGAERSLFRETGARAVAQTDDYTLFQVPKT